MRTYDAKAVAGLERRYATPQVIDQRKRFCAILAPRPGETGLDVGCGPGYLACDMAAEVAPGGRIVAIDRSPDSVASAAALVARRGLAGVVEVRAGDAQDLDFPDGSFDFVAATQVYCHVPDVARAINEAARVLRKGGRLAVLDSDWDMCAWESGDHARMRRMLAARQLRFEHAHLPCELHRLFREAGLALAGVQAFALIETRYDPDSFGAEILQSTRDAALKYGVPAAEVEAWEQDLRARGADGEWFFCLDRFVFTATK